MRTNRRQGIHKHAKRKHNNWKPKGKGSAYEQEYVLAVVSGDRVRIKMCLSKDTYHTCAEADATAYRRGLETGLKLRSYQYAYCCEYHITKSSEREPQAA